MTAITNLPSNKNFLSPLGFTFAIKKTPHVNYFVQSATLPQIQLGQTDIQTPFVRLPIPGDHIDFGQFSVTFRIDEEMRNYGEIFNWIIALGFPDNFDQHKPVAPPGRGLLGQAIPMAGNGIYSDASLMILNSVKAPIIDFQFKDLYPITISDVLFDTKGTDVDYVEATATFAYRSYSLNRL